jgi:antitoxin component YwqK of YwqJK toxin-antitoxin module
VSAETHSETYTFEYTDGLLTKIDCSNDDYVGQNLITYSNQGDTVEISFNTLGEKGEFTTYSKATYVTDSKGDTRLTIEDFSEEGIFKTEIQYKNGGRSCYIVSYEENDEVKSKYTVLRDNDGKIFSTLWEKYQEDGTILIEEEELNDNGELVIKRQEVIEPQQ